MSVPVNLFPATRSDRESLRMLASDGVPLARRYYSQESGRNLDAGEMVRGYEIEEENFVTVTDEELERLAPEKTRDIALRRFVNRNEIPPIYFDRPYFLTPAGNTDKAYRLLAEIMEKNGRAGIATFVMRGKEYLVAIVSDNAILCAETLRFADELRSPDSIGLPEKKKVPKTAVQRFEKVINKNSKDRLSREQLRDEETARLIKLIEKKRSKGKDVVETEEPEQRKGEVIDIMEVLKKSIAAKRKAS